MHCATPFLKRVQVCEGECNEGSNAVLQFLEQEFQSLLTLRSPDAPHNVKDKLAHMRWKYTEAEQQVAMHELEIQALRSTILRKHAELVGIQDEKSSKVNHTGDLLRAMNRNPHLPVEVILRIFELMYYPEAIDIHIKSAQALSLYKISTGFADFPGWRKAIQAQIPLVLVPELRYWDLLAHKLSPMNGLALGRHPRLCELSDPTALAQVGTREVAAIYLVVDDPGYQTHLEATRRFKHRSLVFSAPNYQQLSEGLGAVGKMLWRTESLEIILERQYHGSAFLMGQTERVPHHGPSRLPLLIGDFNPTLRHASLPFGALHGCLPLLAHATTLELYISAGEFIVTNILAGLQELPQSITHLSFRCGFRQQQYPTPEKEDIDNPVSMPNLVELAVRGFDDRATNTLIKCIENARLASLVTKVDFGSDEDMLFHHLEGPQGSKDTNTKVHYEFLEIVHKKFPHLKRLKRATPMSMMGSAAPFLHLLMKPDAVEGTGGEKEWLLPALEVLELPDECDDLLDVLVSLASARLNSDKVSTLRSVTIRDLDYRKRTKTREVADVWRDTQLNALRVVVPDVKIVSGLEIDV